jgi:endonuclease YncB( thermonuclease family)
VPAPTAASTSQPVGDPASVVRISDGDTIVTTLGKVRLIGIDTPEQGECGYQEASRNAAVLVPVGSEVVLASVPGRDDTDRYDRLLRYVRTADGVDLGLAQITAGYAVARYDSRDGFGTHPLQEQYVAADRASPRFTCGG